MLDQSLLDGQFEESLRRIARAARRARDYGICLDRPLGPSHALYLLALSHRALLMSAAQ
jgi:hypothetical protein